MVVPVALEEISSKLSSFVMGLEPESLLGHDAEEMMEVFNRIEHSATAGKSLCARRCVETKRHKHSGARTPIEWLSKKTGDTKGRAAEGLMAAEHLDNLDATAERFRKGDLSLSQVREVAEGATSDPGEEEKLLELATTGSLRELHDEVERIKARKRSEQDEAERLRHLRAKRFLRTWTDPDGAFSGRFSLTPIDGARFSALLRPACDAIFAAARRRGERESPDAYMADALMAAVTGELASDPPTVVSTGEGPDFTSKPSTCDPERACVPDGACDPESACDPDGTCDSERAEPCAEAGGAGIEAPGDCDPIGSPPGAAPAAPSALGPPRKPWVRHLGPTHVILRADLGALLRGRLEDGEICEIQGIGPVSLTEARELLGGDFILDYVLTNGNDIASVVHFRRTINNCLRTALLWQNKSCAVPGCDEVLGLEVDHVTPLEEGGETALSNLALLCRCHHAQKTKDGYRLFRTEGRGRFSWLPPPSKGAAQSEIVRDPGYLNPGNDAAREEIVTTKAPPTGEPLQDKERPGEPTKAETCAPNSGNDPAATELSLGWGSKGASITMSCPERASPAAEPDKRPAVFGGPAIAEGGPGRFRWTGPDGRPPMRGTVCSAPRSFEPPVPPRPPAGIGSIECPSCLSSRSCRSG